MRTASKDPREVKMVRLEYASELEANVTIVGIEREIATVEGSDPSPQNFLAGPLVIDNVNSYGLQVVQDGLDGCAYEIRGLATDSTGLKHLVIATVPVAIEH